MQFLDFCKSKISVLKENYFKRMKKELNLENPKTFTEKQQWLKIYDSNFLKTFCTDKIKIHDYCKKVLQKDICIPLIATYNKPEEIIWEKLPDSFVIKCNHGCKMNIIVKDKSKCNKKEINEKLNKWLNEDYSEHNGCELHYKLIQRKILIEKYMNDGNSDLIDYKFYCFNGKPIFCQVINDRNTNESISHYDMDWNRRLDLDWRICKSIELTKPEKFNEMKNLAEKLSKDFKLVRVDFYLIDHKIYLGELTFTPYSGYQPFKDSKTDLKLGELLKL